MVEVENGDMIDDLSKEVQDNDCYICDVDASERPKKRMKLSVVVNGSKEKQYFDKDGVEYLPTMKALHNRIEEIKKENLKSKEKTKQYYEEELKTNARFIEKLQKEIDRLKDLCKRNNIDV